MSSGCLGSLLLLLIIKIKNWITVIISIIRNSIFRSNERHGRVVNTPASYSGGPRFNCPSWDRRPDWGSSWFSLDPPSQCHYSALKLGHHRFFPNPFQFIIRLSRFHSMLYDLSYWNSVVK
jgi:hypothetical protein